MLRIWRIARVFWTMFTWTAYLQWRAGRLPDEVRGVFRAYRQFEGCRVLCRILGIRIRTEGDAPRVDPALFSSERSQPPPATGMLVVANHFGVLDPIILAAAMPAAFVGKSELRRWPFLGWVAISHGMLLVQRERRTTVTRFTREVRRGLCRGLNVLVFPEGTTSKDLTVLPFKTGAFEAVAGEAEGRVLPVYLSIDEVEGEPAVGVVRSKVVWSDPNLPFLTHAWRVSGLKSISVTVRFGEPIPTEGRDRKELAQVAHEAVEELRDRPETIAT